jgi:hypothetical protein
MHYANYHTTLLDEQALSALKNLEQELGKTLVAYSADDKPATLTAEQVDKLQSLEECLGATVVAY